MTPGLTSTVCLIVSFLLPLIKRSQDSDEPMLSAALLPSKRLTIAHEIQGKRLRRAWMWTWRKRNLFPKGGAREGTKFHRMSTRTMVRRRRDQREKVDGDDRLSLVGWLIHVLAGLLVPHTGIFAF